MLCWRVSVSARSAFLLLAICWMLGASATAQQLGVSSGSSKGSSTQDPKPGLHNPESIDQQFASLLREGRYLAAVNLIEQANQTDISEGLKSTYRQVRPALDGIVVPTDEKPGSAPSGPSKDLVRYDGAVANDAIAQIVERAKQTRVVIVNETHDNPRDRAFVLAVAEALRPLGYSVYAAEAFTNWTGPLAKPIPQRLIADGYARYDTGFYMVDPMFAHLVRRVLQLGYRPLPYEYAPPPQMMKAYFSAPMAARIARREQGEAENLARAIAAAPPTEKFLVHVGYQHAAERPLGPEGSQQEWMAARLARITGINPLTIDQTDLSEYSQAAEMRALYSGLASRVGDSPKVFFKDGHAVASGQMAGAVDLQVVHSPIKLIGGRPDWLQRTGRRAVLVPSELLPKRGRRLVQVFGAGEAADAVPIDQVLVTAGAKTPLVYVPVKGDVRWAVQDD